LLSHIRDGDSAARDRLIAGIEPLLRNFAHGRVPQMLRHQQETADMMQVTWLKVLEKLVHIQVQERGAFFAYLRQVLLNALRDAMRAQARTPKIASEIGENTLQSVVSAENINPQDWLAYEQAPMSRRCKNCRNNPGKQSSCALNLV